MAIGARVPVKKFATTSDTDGVLLTDMPELMGEINWEWVASGVNPRVNNARRLAGGQVSRANHDRIRIDVESFSAGVYTLVDSFLVSIEQFYDINQAREGNNLSTAAGTGVIIAGVNTRNTLLVGRSTSNRILVQQGAWFDNTANLTRGYVLGHDGGALDRRLAPYSNAISRTVTVHRRSATKPSAPSEGTSSDVGDDEIRFDGTSIIFAENTEWSPLERELGGTDPLWLASANFSLEDSGIWYPDEWTVYASGGTFSIEYSTDDGETWSTTLPVDEEFYLYRFRDDTSHWHGPFGVGIEPGSNGWRTVLVVSYAADQANGEVITFDPPLNWQDASELYFTWENEVQNHDGSIATSNVSGVSVPKFEVRTRGSADTSGEHVNQLLFRFAQGVATHWSRGKGLVDPSYSAWLGAATQEDQRLRIDFIGAGDNEEAATSIRVFRGYRTRMGTLHIYLR